MGTLEKIGSFFKKWFSSDAALNGIGQIGAVYGFGAGYGGAGYYGGAGSDGSKWPYGLSSSGDSPILDHWALRQNARSAYFENPLGKAVVETYGNSVVDCGLKLQAEPKADILGISAEQAEQWAENVNERFDIWARSKTSYRDETLNLYQAQRLAVNWQQRDGEYFIRLYYSKRADLLNPLQVQFVDPNQCRGAEYTSTYGFPTGGDGIERDSAGREIAYKIWVRDKKWKYKEIRVPRVGKKSGRVFMLHGFMPELPGQGRGFSRIAHILQNLENMEDYALATLKKCINQSNITMFNKPSADNAASNPFEDIVEGGAGPVPTIDENTVPAEAAAVCTEPVRFFPVPQVNLSVPGSVGVFNLQEGEDLKPFQDTSPLPQYPEYMDAVASYLSASMSMPLERVKMQFGQNYSASRAALILWDRIRLIWENELDSDALSPIYAMWIAGEIAAGRISAPGWSDPRLRAAWLAHGWISAPMPNIDPQKTAKADQTYVTLGAQTLDRVARNLNGSSGKANRAKLAREFDELPVPTWQPKPEGGQ